MQGNTSEPLPAIIGVETVESVDELSGTELTNTPILFNIGPRYVEQFRKDLLTILKRPDIRQEQLFFKIDAVLNSQQLIRVISDIGIHDPQVVLTAEDAQIMSYLRSYAITEYVREAIVALRGISDGISPILESENEKSLIANAEVHDAIGKYEQEISSLKETDSCFTDADAYIPPQELHDSLLLLIDALQKWKSRKTKISGDNEADIAADDYDCYARKNNNSFADTVIAVWEKAEKDIYECFARAYATAKVDEQFRPVHVRAGDINRPHFGSIKEDMLALKEITFTEAKTDFFAVLLKQTSEEDNTPVRVVTCYLEQWRSKAKEIILPMAEALIDSCSNSLNEYYAHLAAAYREHIEILNNEREHLKSVASLQLSDDEQKLQADNDWLAEFADRLNHIERG